MNPWWPLFDLRVRTPRVELRLASDADLLGLIEAARAGIHAPDDRPFYRQWDLAPSPGMERNILKWHWTQRGEWEPTRWTLGLVAVVGDVVVGTQEVNATNFALRREVGSGSWLSLPYQRQGIGREMRSAMLHLAFAGLGAEWALSVANADNERSQAVSRTLGYVDDGLQVEDDDGRQRLAKRFRLSRERWEQHRPDYDISIEGLEPCLPMFGVEGTP